MIAALWFACLGGPAPFEERQTGLALASDGLARIAGASRDDVWAIAPTSDGGEALLHGGVDAGWTSVAPGPFLALASAGPGVAYAVSGGTPALLRADPGGAVEVTGLPEGWTWIDVIADGASALGVAVAADGQRYGTWTLDGTVATEVPWVDVAPNGAFVMLRDGVLYATSAGRVATDVTFHTCRDGACTAAPVDDFEWLDLRAAAGPGRATLDVWRFRRVLEPDEAGGYTTTALEGPVDGFGFGYHRLARLADDRLVGIGVSTSDEVDPETDQPVTRAAIAVATYAEDGSVARVDEVGDCEGSWDCGDQGMFVLDDGTVLVVNSVGSWWVGALP